MTLEEMKEIKKEKGYSMAQLSEYSGVPLGTLQKIFSGVTENPRYATKRALEKALLKDVDDPAGGYGNGIRQAHFVREEAAFYDPGYGRSNEPYTIEDYYTLPDDRRVELIDGIFYDMASPSFVHQHIAATIFPQISNFLKERNTSCIPMMAPVDVRLDRDDKTIVQPDILILCDSSKICKWGIMGAPDFVLEIISPATRKKDYTKKLQKYTDAGVKEYWIVDPYRKVLVTYDLLGDCMPCVQALEGKAGLTLYHGELLIDLDEIAGLIQDWPEDI